MLVKMGITSKCLMTVCLRGHLIGFVAYHRSIQCFFAGGEREYGAVEI